MHALPVSQPLAHFVRAMRVSDAQESQSGYVRLPDGEAELLVRFGKVPTFAKLIGTRTTTHTSQSNEQAHTLLVRFRVAGAYAFFERPMSELTDRMLPLAELWDAEACEDFGSAHDTASVAQVTTRALERVLLRAAPREPATVPAIRRAVRLLQHAPSLPRVPELASQVGLSERQLRRGFDSVVGLSPKRFLRIARFRRALRTARQTSRPEWAAIAEQAGYFDQAHMIADFRELTGFTPSGFLQQRATSGYATPTSR